MDVEEVPDISGLVNVREMSGEMNLRYLPVSLPAHLDEAFALPVATRQSEPWAVGAPRRRSDVNRDQPTYRLMNAGLDGPRRGRQRGRAWR